MKIRSMFYSALLATMAFAMANCSGNKKDQTETESHNPAAHDSVHRTAESTAATDTGKPQFQVDASFQQQLANVFTSYVELKDAFVASDAHKVKTQATKTNDALAKIDMKLLSGAAHNDWMTYLMPIESALKEIQAGADIEAQRKAFSALSNNLYKTVKAFGLGGKEAFYEFCPMAFNNEGAYWLSDREQIRNPYFGDKMLTCGEVKEKLK
jgi:hypothetical protein